MSPKKTILLLVFSLIIFVLVSPLNASDNLDSLSKPSVLVTDGRRVDFNWDTGDADSAVKWSIQLQGVILCTIKGVINLEEVTFNLDVPAKDTKLRVSWYDMADALKAAAASSYGCDPYDVRKMRFKGTACIMALDSGNTLGLPSESSEPFNIPD